MPIKVDSELHRMTQLEFGAIAYDVMKEVFDVHTELGSLFDEKVYRNALAARFDNMQTEVRIDVSFQNFHKPYFIDAIVANGAVFEFKTVKSLTAPHRNQLLNYLFLTGLGHGKLINFRPEQVEHEFVNTSLKPADLKSFAFIDKDWEPTDGFGADDKTLVLEMLRDWGTGLERCLYDEALFHFLGGKERLLTEVEVYRKGSCIARQTVPLCGEDATVRVTMFPKNSERFLNGLNCFIRATTLKHIHWLNIARDEVTFKTIKLSAL